MRSSRLRRKAFFLLAHVAVAASRAAAASPDEALEAALAARDRAAFEAAVTGGASTTPAGPGFLLSLAAAFDAPAAIRAIVARGVPVDGLDPNGETALFVAAASGSSSALAALLDLGADPSLAVQSRRAPSWSPLFAAALSGHAEACSRLLGTRGGRSLVQRVDRDGRTPLFHAALQGDLPVVRLLLAAGSDPDAQDARGESPRTIAAKAGRRGVLDTMAGAPPAGRPAPAAAAAAPAPMPPVAAEGSPR